MRQKKFWFRMSGILAVLATALLLPTGAAAASTFKVLHEFTGKDGANPDAGLIFDAAGNLYGTTSAGGAFGKGTVFKLTPNSNGSWTESVLHSFCVLTNCADGFNPVAGLIFDGAGNFMAPPRLALAAVAVWSSSSSRTPTAPGRRLCCTALLGPPTGLEPLAGLIFDAAGKLYGTTAFGGPPPVPTPAAASSSS